MSEDRVQTSDRQDRPSGEQRQGGSRRPDRNKSRGKRSRSRRRDDRRPQGKGSGQGQDRQSAKRRPAPRNPKSKQRDAESRQRVAETKKRETDSKPRETQDKSQTARQQQRNVRDGAGENQPRRNKRRRLQQRNKKHAQELEVQVKLETFEDYRRENERLEKEIWLEIASIRTISLD